MMLGLLKDTPVQAFNYKNFKPFKTYKQSGSASIEDLGVWNDLKNGRV